MRQAKNLIDVFLVLKEQLFIHEDAASLSNSVKSRSVLLFQPLFIAESMWLLSRTNLESLPSKLIALLFYLALHFLVVDSLRFLYGLF